MPAATSTHEMGHGGKIHDRIHDHGHVTATITTTITS